MRFLKVMVLGFLLLPLIVGAETIRWVPAPTWNDNTAVSVADAAKFTFYLRIWRGTNPATVPPTAFFFGETRNGITTWTDNILTKANAYVTPPLVPGDNVIIAVSAALLDNGVERDSWDTQKPGGSIAYRIPGGVVVPAPTVTFSAAPTTVVKGTCSILSWSTTNATSTLLDQGTGSVATTGTKSVCPVVTTPYTLTAMGAGGTTIKVVIVTVTIPAQPGCNAPSGITITN